MSTYAPEPGPGEEKALWVPRGVSFTGSVTLPLSAAVGRRLTDQQSDTDASKES